MREHLEILPPRGVSRLITVQFDAEDRNLAAEVPNAIGDEFIKQDLELRQKSNSHTSEWLSGELEGLRTRLRDSEQALQAYTQSAGLMSIDPDQETVAQARLRQLQARSVQGARGPNQQGGLRQSGEEKRPDDRCGVT